MTSTNPTSYFLSAVTYACVIDGQVVILDLRRDKYLCLDAGASTLLCAHIDRLSSDKGLLQASTDARLTKVLSHLTDNGILSTAPPVCAITGNRSALLRPMASIVPRPPFREPVRIHHAVRYFVSILSARSSLRVHTLHRIVLCERRKTTAPTRVVSPFDPARAALLCSVYSRLRVIATGPRQCLFDSLALKLFLAKYGVFPRWIFGVRLHPFAAHCWLQHGDTLVNDSLDFVRGFTPIMAA